MLNEVMNKIGADKTPHEARHTFETNLDNAKGNRNNTTFTGCGFYTALKIPILTMPKVTGNVLIC